MSQEQNWSDLVRDGNLGSAITSTKNQIRENPEKADLRLILSHLLALDAQWDVAEKQLKLFLQLSADPEKELLGATLANLFSCNSEREAIFSGAATAAIFGEPPEWIAGIIQMNKHLVEGELAAAKEVHKATFSKISPVPAIVDGESVDWLGDSDWRLGPMVEAMIAGSYYWVPVHHIRKIAIAEPRSLRDLVWASVNFTWITGGESPGFIPTRYPKISVDSDDAIKLARTTEWFEPSEDIILAKGQRVWTNGEKDYSMLDVRTIEFLQEPVL